VDELLAAVEAEERDPSDAERDLLKRQKARLDELEPQIVQLVEMEERRNSSRDARALVRSRHETTEEGGEEGDGGGEGEGEGEGEGASYRTFAQYARDALLVRFPFIAATVEPGVRRRAAERLTRAVEPVKTADVPGLIRPQYVQEIIAVINKTRPIVQRSRSLPLASGKIQYPKVTAAPTVAEQVTEKTEVGVGTMTVTMVEEVAKTYLTSANFSWQTVQWSNPDALALWFDLAATDYAKKTEAAAAAALAAVDATPSGIGGVGADSLEDWVTAITGAAGGILATSGRYADTIYADVASGYALLGLVSNAAPTFLATGGGDLSGGRYPSIGGLQLVISPQLPATTVIVGDSSALLTAETAGAPVELRAVEPSIGGLEIGIIGAFLVEITDATAFAELTPG